AEARYDVGKKCVGEPGKGAQYDDEDNADGYRESAEPAEGAYEPVCPDEVRERPGEESELKGVFRRLVRYGAEKRDEEDPRQYAGIRDHERQRIEDACERGEDEVEPSCASHRA